MQTNEPKPRVLLVDDEKSILDFLKLGLSYEGFDTREANNGTQAIALAAEFKPDIAVLDVMMSGMDGLAVCQKLRASSDVAIIMLTARDDAPTTVSALTLGADDYVSKPFDFKILVARMRALLRRRGKHAPQDMLSVGDLTLNRASREVHRGSAQIELTQKEFDVLEMLMEQPRRVLTREMILNRVWGYDFDGNTNVVDVYISYLRAKLTKNVSENDDEAKLIHTVRGVGFTLKP